VLKYKQASNNDRSETALYTQCLSVLKCTFNCLQCRLWAVLPCEGAAPILRWVCNEWCVWGASVSV